MRKFSSRIIVLFAVCVSISTNNISNATTPDSDTVIWCTTSWICTEQLDLSKQYSNKEAIIKANGYNVKAYLTKPAWNNMDIIMLLHGTSMDDEKSKELAKSMPQTISWVERLSSYFTVSIAFKETNIAIGDNFLEPEQAFIALKKSKNFQNFTTDKIYMLGHSVGWFIAVMINTRQGSDGIIANGVGPLDIAHTCDTLIKNPNPQGAGIEIRAFCTDVMEKRYGSLSSNPEIWKNLSVESHICSSISPILFIQWDQDKKMQMEEFPALEQFLRSGSCNIQYETMWVKWAGHGDTFASGAVWDKITNFLTQTPIVSNTVTTPPKTSNIVTPLRTRTVSKTTTTDVTFFSYANILADAGIIMKQSSKEGYNLGSNITRAEMAKIAVNVGKISPTECTGKIFSDVTIELGDLCGYIEAAANAGIINGTAQKFRPADFITRAESLKMLLSTAGIVPSLEDQWFIDLGSDTSLNGYINAAAKAGIINKNIYFNPNNIAIRGVIFKITANVNNSTHTR